MLKYPCYQPFVVSASEPSGREVGRAVGFGERRHPPPRGFVQHFATDILAGASTDQVVRPDGILIDDALPQSWHGSPAFVEAPSARIPSDSWQSRSGGGNSGRWVSPTFPRRARRRFGRRGSSFDRRTMSRQGGLVGYPVRGDRYRAPRRHRDWIHRSRISRSRIEPRAVSGSTARPFWRISRRPAATSRRAARRTGSR